MISVANERVDTTGIFVDGATIQRARVLYFLDSIVQH